MNFSRRDFLKAGGMAGVAATVSIPTFGRMALAGQDADFFTIAVISDTQNYCDGSDSTHVQPLNANIFKTQNRYLVQNRDKLNLEFVTHVGDVVQKGDGSTVYGSGAAAAANLTKPQNYEWQNAVEAIDILHHADIPFGVCPGNHDYDNMYHASATAYPPLVSTAPWWKDYFGSGSKYFKRKPWYVGASDKVGYISNGAGKVNGVLTGDYPAAGTPCNYGLSSAQIFSGAGKQFLHISLEMEAGDNAIAWAQRVIDSYHGLATIVTTHSYLAPPNWGDNAPLLQEILSRNTASYLKNSPGGWNGADDIFAKLIYPNRQIFMVLCGHSWTSTSTVVGESGTTISGVSKGEYVRIDNHADGSPIYQVLSDYQGNTTLGSAGGDGWYRFMQFDLTDHKIHFYTVNPCQIDTTTKEVTLRTHAKKAGKAVLYADGMSDFDQPEGFSDFSLALPIQVLKAPHAKRSKEVLMFAR